MAILDELEGRPLRLGLRLRHLSGERRLVVGAQPQGEVSVRVQVERVRPGHEAEHGDDASDDAGSRDADAPKRVPHALSDQSLGSLLSTRAA
jgi:hypothetical protein